MQSIQLGLEEAVAHFQLMVGLFFNQRSSLYDWTFLSKPSNAWIKLCVINLQKQKLICNHVQLGQSKRINISPHWSHRQLFSVLCVPSLTNPRLSSKHSTSMQLMP